MASPTTTTTSSTLINCTPHPLNLYIGNELVATFPASKYAPRVKQELQIELGKFILENGMKFPILNPPTFGVIEGLPKNDPDNRMDIVVSMLVAERLKIAGWHGRVFAPDTSPAGAVRDDKGAIIGTRNLIQYF